MSGRRCSRRVGWRWMGRWRVGRWWMGRLCRRSFSILDKCTIRRWISFATKTNSIITSSSIIAFRYFSRTSFTYFFLSFMTTKPRVFMTMIRDLQFHFPWIEYQSISIFTPLIIKSKWVNITLRYLLSNSRAFNGCQINVTCFGYFGDFIPNPIKLDGIQSDVMFKVLQYTFFIFEKLVQFA